MGPPGGALKFKGRNKVLISSRQINENCCVTCPEKVAQKLSIPYVILLENNDFPAGVGGGQEDPKITPKFRKTALGPKVVDSLCNSI